MPTFPNIVLSLVLFSSDFSHASAAAANTDGHHVVSVQALQALHQSDDQACSPKEYEGTGLKIVHRHGPCSPLGDQRNASHLQILEHDQSRVNWLKSSRRLAQIHTEHVDLLLGLGASPGISLGTGTYIVKVGFGTPKEDMTVIFDTGSSLSWIQCQPCSGSCYQQQDPIFNPTQSSSYFNVSCNSANCSGVDVVTGCSSSSSSCVYAVAYGDGSISQGYLAHDTLTLTASDVVPNFQFGCGQNTSGLFGRTAGLLGLGRGEMSLVSQTASKFGQIFSYYLPSTTSSSGYLKFGADAIPPGVRFTRMLAKQEQPLFYFVDMVGISVGGVALPIPASTFSSGPGTIIDCGTVITRLPPAAYAALRSAFRQAMSSYKMAASPVSLFDTCYDLSGVETVSVPNIELSFHGGVDVNVDASGILMVLSTNSILGCLSFAGNNDSSDLAIIGSRQQQGLEVVFDVACGRLGFSDQGGPEFSAQVGPKHINNTKKQSHTVVLIIH